MPGAFKKYNAATGNFCYNAGNAGPPIVWLDEYYSAGGAAYSYGSGSIPGCDYSPSYCGWGGSLLETGRNGISGIVIIRYISSTYRFSGGNSCCISGGWAYHKFISSGTLSPI